MTDKDLLLIWEARRKYLYTIKVGQDNLPVDDWDIEGLLKAQVQHLINLGYKSPEEVEALCNDCEHIKLHEQNIRNLERAKIATWLDSCAGYVFEDGEDFGKRRAIFQSDIDNLKRG